MQVTLVGLSRRKWPSRCPNLPGRLKFGALRSGMRAADSLRSPPNTISFGYVPERDPKPKPLLGLPYEVIIFGHTSCDASRVACGMEEDETCQCVGLTPRLRCMPAMRVP